MRKLSLALAIGLLAFAGGPAVGIQHAAAASSQAKVVIVVGATQGTTASYRSDGDASAATFAKYTSNVVKVYSPDATWANVQAATQGASVLIYIGHGSGYPNPYNGSLVAADNGMGLNYPAGSGLQSDTYTDYYGAGYMAQLGLAPNAIVLLNHLCYASGDSEGGLGNPTQSVAQTRVDGYASGFLSGNARAVIAEGMGSLSPYIDALFTQNETIDQMWKTYPGFHNHVTAWGSTQNPGFTSQIDPNLDRPQSDGDVYYRSMVSMPGLSTTGVGLVTSFAPATYHAVTPTRLLDTRNGIGLAGAFSSHVARYFQITGGVVPANATAVTGNLTVTGQTSLGYLSISPAAMNNPTSSTLNFPVGDDRANSVTVALGGGILWVTYAAPTLGPTAQVIFDVTGYFTPDASGATYVPLTPNRILDTRSGKGLSGTFSSHVSRSFGVTGGTSGVPSNATAVTGNLTVSSPTAAGFLYLGPTAMTNPNSSALNFPVGEDGANGVTVALGSGGVLYATYAAATLGPTAQVIFDVTGYFVPGSSGASYVPLSPTRLLDTRYNAGLPGASSSHVARSFAVTGGTGPVPTNATAVTGNLTVTGQTAAGFLYLGSNSMNDPTSSTLNFLMGDDRANATTVALGAGGCLWVTYAASTLGPTAHVIFDVTGYFVPAGG